jgi:hypothetical protein
MTKKNTRPVTDATLDVEILPGKKLRDATYADLINSAEQDEKAAKTLNASAKWMRERGEQLKR